MLVAIIGIAVGLGLGALLGGRLAGLARLEVRLGGVFVAAVLVQLVVVRRLTPDPQVPLAVAGGLLALSSVAVLAALWPNRRVPGLWLVGVGVLLNVLAGLPHGGLMPVTAEALATAGRPVPAELPPSEARPYTISKDVVLSREQIPLWEISDRFVIPRGWPLASVFSPGDVAIAAGIAWTLAYGLARGREAMAIQGPAEPA